MITAWVQAQAVKLLAALAAVLAIALAFVVWRADQISEARDAYKDKLAVEETRHAVTRASLASLQLRLAAMVREGELRKERLDKAMRETEAQVAPLREEARKLERRLIDIRTVEGL
jgi:Lon protease-like protein